MNNGETLLHRLGKIQSQSRFFCKKAEQRAKNGGDGWIFYENIENNPFLTEQQKEEQQHQIDIQADMLKQLSGTESI